MLHPVYLLLGPEKGRKEDFINKIKKDLGDCQVSKFYGFEDYENEFYVQLMNEDFFCSQALVIMEETEQIKTAGKLENLVSYIKNPSVKSTLVLKTDEHFVNRKIMDSMQNASETVVVFYEMFDNKKEQWLKDYFRENGFSIEDQAVSAIIERVENNILDFKNICSQMIVYFKSLGTSGTFGTQGMTGTQGAKREIYYSDIDNFLNHTKFEDVYSLFNYIAYGQLESALASLNAICNTTDQSRVSGITTALAFCFRRLYSACKILETSGKNEDEALKEKYFLTDKPVTRYKDKCAYKNAMKYYKTKDLQRILAFLAEYDIKVKEAGPQMQKILLERCIVRIMKKKARAFEEYSFATL